MAGLPHGVLGGIPVGDLPSPPPCGWSRGFMTTPRTSGRWPRWRARPALPRFWFSWSRLLTWPTVAMQRIGTRRTREALRTLFEIDPPHIAAAAVTELGR